MFGNMHALFSNAYEKNIDIFTIILPRGDFFPRTEKIHNLSTYKFSD